MKQKISVLILVIIVISCNTFHTNEMIEKGNEVIMEYKNELTELTKICNTIAVDKCAMYEIMTSRITDMFMFSEYKYNKNEKIIEEESYVTISKYNKNLIWKYLPNKYITDFVFVKDVYVSFRFDRIRDKQYNYAKLIYCYNKNNFKKLFPDYVFYEKDQISNIIESEDWVYFYDEHWAITTSLDMYQMTKEECKNLIQ